MKATLRVDVRCELGEGPIWHADRATLIFFDIVRQTLLEVGADGRGLRVHGFGEPVAAAGVVDADRVAVVGASGLTLLDLDTGGRTPILALEADDPSTRANDSRVAPDGAFWVGTMGRRAEPGRGAVYRVAGGRTEALLTGVTIPNATCFSPDGRRAYWADSTERRLLTWPLDAATGRPIGEPDLFRDLAPEGLIPDGAVVDAAGNLWNAQWGAGRVACYAPDGRFLTAVETPGASRASCPAFGGPDLRTLFVTTAREDLSPAERAAEPLAGAVFAAELDTPGLPEHRFRI